MNAADRPAQRPPQARLLAIDRCGRISHAARDRLVDFLRTGDLVIANDASTLPASLHGRHQASGAAIEVRLTGRQSFAPDAIGSVTALVFGAGDFRIRTEDRPAPPRLVEGDRLLLGPLVATVDQVLDHPRLVALRFDGPAGAIWAGLARHGRPIQYAHIAAPLTLWDVWAPIGALPVAVESPSAGYALDWQSLAAMRARGIGFATVTHAAGISSTGDEELDRRLPFAEIYRIPEGTADAIRAARARGGRVIAIGTTVVRALEHAARRDATVRHGDGVATQRIHARSRLRVVDGILSGTHESGTSHYELLRAFTDDATLQRANAELEARNYLTHEFGDSVLIERRKCGCGDAEPKRSGAPALAA